MVCDAFNDRCDLFPDASAAMSSDPEVRSISSFGRPSGMAGTTLFAGDNIGISSVANGEFGAAL